MSEFQYPWLVVPAVWSFCLFTFRGKIIRNKEEKKNWTGALSLSLQASQKQQQQQKRRRSFNSWFERVVTETILRTLSLTRTLQDEISSLHLCNSFSFRLVGSNLSFPSYNEILLKHLCLMCQTKIKLLTMMKYMHQLCTLPMVL